MQDFGSNYIDPKFGTCQLGSHDGVHDWFASDLVSPSFQKDPEHLGHQFPLMHRRALLEPKMAAASPAFATAAGLKLSGSPPLRPCSACPARPPPVCKADGEQEGAQQPDIIERVWSTLFGPKQAEPFGLKRFDRDRFPELYPATLDEFADPVDSDNEDAKLFRPLMARTQLQTRAVQLLYDAERDGWTSKAFHEGVDRKGACVVLARTPGAVFGGVRSAFPSVEGDNRRTNEFGC